MTYEEWIQQGTNLFGSDFNAWKFICPACGYVQSVAECKAAKMPENAIAFSCVGRWQSSARDAFSDRGPGPCNYAGGGLFRLNPATITTPDGKTHDVFAFAK